MKVKELIVELQKWPENENVRAWDYGLEIGEDFGNPNKWISVGKENWK